MELFIKLLILSPLIVATCGRYVSHERNFSNESEALETDCNCDWRYFKHYETKGCVVDQEDSCGCPKKFNCPSLNQTLQSPSKVCTYRNKDYKIGSKIITSNDCQMCRCRDGIPPFISCITKECFGLEYASGNNCHLVYREDKCCAVSHECLENASEAVVASNKTCEYNGRSYPYGSKIYPIDDPCQICICNEFWNGTDNSSCYQHDCILERSRSKLDIGCVPVYHENECCPIEFYCPSSHNVSYSLLSNNETENNETSFGDQCNFAGASFEIGEELSMDNPCIKCTCSVPPDFTCVHQSCSPPPNAENCYAVYNPEMCCPNYECMVADAEADGCPTPLCADSSCRIETPPGHECPTCVCGERMSELEHNSVQQVQQISQNAEPFQQFEEAGQTADDYSDDELQMMPIQMQDSEGEFSVMERIILPVSEDFEENPEEDFIERDNSSSENNASIEIDNGEFEDSEIERMQNSSIDESEEENKIHVNTTAESMSNQTEKFLQKRSDISDAANPDQAQVPIPFEQTKLTEQESNTGIEREGGITENNGTKDFEDELESFKNKLSNKNGTISNEILGTNDIEVPAGCPTPMCEGPWCKIGIPPGHDCPTCICKRHVGNEP